MQVGRLVRTQIAPAAKPFVKTAPKKKKVPYAAKASAVADPADPADPSRGVAAQTVTLTEQTIGKVLWDRGIKLTPKGFDEVLNVVRVVSDNSGPIHNPNKKRSKALPRSSASGGADDPAVAAAATDPSGAPEASGAGPAEPAPAAVDVGGIARPDRLLWGVVPAAAHWCLPFDAGKIAEGGVAKAEAKLTEVLVAAGINIGADQRAVDVGACGGFGLMLIPASLVPFTECDRACAQRAAAKNKKPPCLLVHRGH